MKNNILPNKGWMVLCPLHQEERELNGIILPAQMNETDEILRCEIIEMNEDDIDDFATKVCLGLCIKGDTVIIPKYEGMKYQLDDGVRYRLVNVKNIVGKEK